MCKQCLSSGRCPGECARNSTTFFKTVLVAVDDSSLSHDTAAAADRLARRLNARVILVTVIPAARFNLDVTALEPEIRDVQRQNGEIVLARIRDRMTAPSRVETALLKGDPATEILRAARFYEANLIVMGTHARGRMGEAVFGSIACAVARGSLCPVMTVAGALVGTRRAENDIKAVVAGGT